MIPPSFYLDKSQEEAIQTTDGPVRIIGVPGSGKTEVIVRRAMHILNTKKDVMPKQILITTFTDKAASELRQRVSQCAKKCNYNGPIYEMKIQTIHSICDDIIRRFVNDSPLEKNYAYLDELTQKVFVDSNFDNILQEQLKINGKYLGKWNDKLEAIKGMYGQNGIIDYFNKIAEGLIDINELRVSKNPFLANLADAYENYRNALYAANKIDFAHQLKIVYGLLQKPGILEEIRNEIKYIMVDEYQDTNSIQEQILLKLARPSNNICIVGDEDQALYRFRGATVRNILEFDKHFSQCQTIILNINYRSHPKIISACNQFMQSIDWSDPNAAVKFRLSKIVKENPNERFQDYPAIFSIQGSSKIDEGRKFAQLINYLKENKIIEDYSDVALLLRSVRLQHSRHYIEALDESGISYFVPRARRFFENKEIQLMIGCYALLFGIDGNMLSRFSKPSFTTLRNYVDRAIANLKLCYQTNPQLEQYIQQQNRAINNLKEVEISNMHIRDYLNELLSYSPFSKISEDETIGRNLAKFSYLLEVFQNFYNVEVVTGRNKQWIPNTLFVSFINLLLEIGIDDYEDPDNPIPVGHVQIMTIHQSKGLEFPVVIVGSLSPNKPTLNQRDTELHEFYHRKSFEPENRVADFDLMRQYYVAFSRAAKLLVLTGTLDKCNNLTDPIWNRLDRWPHLKTNTLSNQQFDVKRPFIPKRSYSLTSHIHPFEICPQKYKFQVEYGFFSSKYTAATFGTLVHQTLEDIHKMVKEGKLGNITNEMIRDRWLESNYQSLVSSGMRPLTREQKYAALDHILDYFNQNYDNLQRVIQTEVDVSIEKPGYILRGRIDLLQGNDGKFEILDFKTENKPDANDPLLQDYYRQLYLYAYIFKEKYGKYPHKLFIYWTSERDRDQALMEVPFNGNDIKSAGEHFDIVVNTIQKKDFQIKKIPDREVCKGCDFRRHCVAQGIIKLKKETSWSS